MLEGTRDDELRDLADRFGTPLYVFDARSLRARVDHLRRALPRGTGLCYAAKANTFVLPAIEPLVDRVEACSPGECRICSSCDVPGEKVVVSGVHKDAGMLEWVLDAYDELAAVTIESRAQLGLVREAARASGRRLPVLLRLASGSQFGLDRASLVGAARELAGASEVELVGLQLFSGTQKTSQRRVRRELEALDALACEIGESCGRSVPLVEYGPGLPVAYFEGEDVGEPLLLEGLSEVLGAMRFGGDVVLELGRSLVASCGTYLTSVVDAKEVAGQRYAIVDGGMHHLVYYGRSMALRRPLCHALPPRPGGLTCEAGTWSVCGSLCSTNDVLAKQVPFEALGVETVLAFERAGAYCATEGMSLFLSRDLPRVVGVGQDGAPRLLRDVVPTSPLNAPRERWG